MNRRELLGSVLSAGFVVPDVNKVSVSDGNHPIIILSTKSRLSAQQWKSIRGHLDKEEQRIGCKFVLAVGNDVRIASNAPYFARERFKDYEIEVHCQTHEELKEWFNR